MNLVIMVTIILYLCMVIIVGMIVGNKTKKNSEGFFLGGRSMGPLVTAMSAEASDMSSYLLMGIPGLAYFSGLADASWTAIGLAAGTYLNFLLVARRLRIYSKKLGAITIPSFISKRYDEKKPVLLFISALIILVFFIPYVSSGLTAIGKLLNSLFGWDYKAGVLIGAFVIISYSTLGGFGAVAMMDLIQSIIMTFAITVIILFSIQKAGGFSNVIENAKSLKGYFDLHNTFNQIDGTSSPYGFINIISTLAWGLGYFGMPHILVRFMAIKDENKLKTSRRIASIWVVISMFASIFIGVTGLAVSKAGVIPYLQGNSEAETVIVKLASVLSESGFIPAIISGIIISGIFAATMSTADSQLIAAGSALSSNILGDALKIKLNEKQELLAARITIIAIALFAIFLAFNPDSSIFVIVAFAWAGFGATFGPVMLLSLFWKRSTREGAITALIVGMISVFFWKFLIRPLGGAFDIYELLPAFILAFIGDVLVSLATPAPKKEIIREFENIK